MSNPSNGEPAVGEYPALDPGTELEPKRPTFYDRLRPYVDPFLQAAWLNLRVWVPFLANPDFRDRRVAFGARENRDGTKWEITLPRRCWECGTTERLMTREYDRQLRSFEAPIGILVSSFALAFFFLLLSGWLGAIAFWLFLLALVAGGAMLFVKSWNERVRLVIATCPEHADALRSPGLAVYDNELSVIMPTSQLARAAREELLAKRRSGQRYAEAAPAADATMKPAETGPRPAPDQRYQTKDYKRDELPPIKLDE